MNLVALIVFLVALPQAYSAQDCSVGFGPKKYSDGVFVCPSYNPKTGPFELMQCTINAPRVPGFYHVPTASEVSKIQGIVTALKAGNTKQLLNFADKMDYQVCRKVDPTRNDSWLLLVAKPKVLSTFVAPLLMLREKNANGILLQSPHDLRDGIDRSTKMLFEKTNALAEISNSFPRGIAGTIQSGCGKGQFVADMAHSTFNLGYEAFKAFADTYPNSRLIHMHGYSFPGVIFTDGTPQPAKEDGFLAAFALGLEKAYTDLKPEIPPNSMVACESGTVIPQKDCGMTEAFVEGKYLTGETNPMCGWGGKKQNNRFIGVEFGKNVKFANFMIEIVNYLEANYPPISNTSY